MEKIWISLIILASIGLCSCAIKSGDGKLLPAELKEAGGATMPPQQNIKTLYNHAAFVASTKKEKPNANP